jgi:hypothetical protein
MYNTTDLLHTVIWSCSRLVANKPTVASTTYSLYLQLSKKTSKEIENVQSPFPGDDMKAPAAASSAAVAVKS